MKKLFIIFMFVWSFGLSEINAADTIIADSCSNSDVQAAINNAHTGDTVVIPSGVTTWSGAVDIPTETKITLQGAGYNNTILTYTTIFLTLNESGSRITGIQFILPAEASVGDTMILVKGTGWRIDHCKFNNQSGKSQAGVSVSMANVTTQPEGLVDNNYFYCARVVTGLSAYIKEDGTSKDHVGWTTPLNLGGSDSVFIEDNYFEALAINNVMDSNYGGYYVFRYNTVENSSVMAHGIQGNNRATRKWEIYKNIFVQTGTAGYPAFLRGGTGVVFDNELVGTWGTPEFVLDHIRSCSDETTSGLCNGESPWDENQSGVTGYRCRDQIGASLDAVLWNSKVGEEGAFTQTTEAAYAWNNWIYPTEQDRLDDTNGVAVEFVPKGVCANEAIHLVNGRDFINNGTTVKPGYTPYAYPHPLRNIGGGTWTGGGSVTVEGGGNTVIQGKQ